MKVASYALPSSAIIFFFLIVVADLRGLFTNKCTMYTNITLVLFDWSSDSTALDNVDTNLISFQMFYHVKSLILVFLI